MPAKLKVCLALRKLVLVEMLLFVMINIYSQHGTVNMHSWRGLKQYTCSFRSVNQALAKVSINPYSQGVNMNSHSERQTDRHIIILMLTSNCHYYTVNACAELPTD
jgi:hypothetical protein